MVYNGLQWLTMVYNGLQWFKMVYNGSQWFIMVYNGLQWFAMVHNGLQWFTMVDMGLQLHYLLLEDLSFATQSLAGTLVQLIRFSPTWHPCSQSGFQRPVITSSQDACLA